MLKHVPESKIGKVDSVKTLDLIVEYVQLEAYI